MTMRLLAFIKLVCHNSGNSLNTHINECVRWHFRRHKNIFSMRNFRNVNWRKDQGWFGFSCFWLCVCACEFMWASSDSYRFQIGQIFRRNHHILSSVVRIHKACIAPQNQSTYYVFIKRKHIPTLIFKWIFKRNTQSHPLSMCSSLLSPGQSYSICSFLSLFLTLSSPDALTKQIHTRFGSGWRTRCRQRSQKGHKHTHILLHGFTLSSSRIHKTNPNERNETFARWLFLLVLVLLLSNAKGTSEDATGVR